VDDHHIPAIKLNNGVPIPQLGLGVWQAADGPEVERAVDTALEAGYRLIDTAAIYGNERGVGHAVKRSGIPREELFITTKLWNDSHSHHIALHAFEASRQRLGLDYIDLYLIHWPVPAEGKFATAWKALEELHAAGRVRAIGVCNFKPHHLEELLKTAEIKPAVNQIELHPRLQQIETRALCTMHGIAVEAYSPLMQGGEILRDPLITELARKHHKTPAQIVLRWHMQNGFIAIPKSVNPLRIRENANIFDFELSADELLAVNALNRDERVGADPDFANFK
jgi:diketogulonate reductase-like aldo/keto reductase